MGLSKLRIGGGHCLPTRVVKMFMISMMSLLSTSWARAVAWISDAS
jgi:hypothetical protein